MNITAILGAVGICALVFSGADLPWIVGAAIVWLALTYNSIIHVRNQAESAYSTIDVLLSKRHDLIPNLVDTVRRFIEHESDVLETVTALRARAVDGGLDPAARAELEGQISRSLAQVVATAEAYPELKSSQSFGILTASLNEVEEQISAARRAYNAAAKAYNDALDMFPTNLVAPLARLGKRTYFEAPVSHHERPQVGELFRS